MASNLALPFTAVVGGGSLTSSVKWGQQFLVLANKADDDG